ncbi:fimbrial protein [Klebsiella sp. BIGb0407]|uniref:fimbrial protein n=1 Tax=Klebsiella sp. BIGb0407 TaxID=2940603 RepID=UPI002167E0FE|nr:fimbrial protein [Klebsiella sp. BIGb0407]MCS3433407.1 hypothetical protein [Klebsiella sp. BIGb0407]
MTFIKKSLSILVITLLQINQVFAFPEFWQYMNHTTPVIDVSGPADQTKFGEVIYNSGSSTPYICNSSDVNYVLRSIVYEPLATWTGRTFQSSPAHLPIVLFESGVPGFSISPLGGNLEDGPTASYLSLSAETKTIWTGYKENKDRVANPHKMVTGAYLYKDETRFTGETVIPKQTMYRYLCKDANGTTQEAYYFDFRPLNATGTVTGCTPANSAVVLDMDKIAQSTIENADSSTLIGTKQSTFSLQCDPNINVFVSIVDLSDQKNSSDTATLTADSTATGVRFAVTDPSGTRLQFGPDGSAKDVPGQEKYLIKNSGTASDSRHNPVSTRLGFSYVRKPGEVIKPGTAKAVIGLTYSYQ